MMSKFLSRKFLVFIIATILVILGKISDITWLAVACLWLGIEGILDYYFRR